MLDSPDVCNCTMPYVPRTVPAYAVRDPSYTAEVFALTLVEIDVPPDYGGTYTLHSTPHGNMEARTLYTLPPTGLW